MANADSLQGLMKWLHREEWRKPFNDLLERHLGPPCEQAGIALEELADKLGNHHASVLWGCVFEDFLAYDPDDDGNIVDDYLKRRGWKESVANKRYMMGLRTSVMSLYEVSDIVRDQSFLARDLLRGGPPVRVREKSATHSLKQWDRLALRVVRIGSKIEMAGGALAFDHELSETICGTFAALRKDVLSEVAKSTKDGGKKLDSYGFDTEILRRYAFLFTHIWLDDALELVLNPTLPALYNSDGDEIAPTTIRYPLKEACDRAALEAALTAMPNLHRAGENLWNWSVAAAPAAAQAPAGARTFTTTFEDGSVSMGSLEVEEKTLKLETNSPQRALKGRALLDPVIGAFVGEPVLESQTVDEMMASGPADDGPAPSSSLSPAEQRVIAHEAIERHYRGLLDQPVPMLGGVSPRKAAKTKKGREKLVAWLKLLENSQAQQAAESPLASYDVRWIWDELGIADLRQ